MSIYKDGESNNLTKRAHTHTDYNKDQILELARCMSDPFYFMENFMYIQHPMDGRVLFEPYKFQKGMIKTIADNRYSILLTARQMGKTNVYTTIINDKTDNVKIKIGSLIKLSFKEKIVTYLENLLLKLSKT